MKKDPVKNEHLKNEFSAQDNFFTAAGQNAQPTETSLLFQPAKPRLVKTEKQPLEELNLLRSTAKQRGMDDLIFSDSD